MVSSKEKTKVYQGIFVSIELNNGLVTIETSRWGESRAHNVQMWILVREIYNEQKRLNNGPLGSGYGFRAAWSIYACFIYEKYIKNRWFLC